METTENISEKVHSTLFSLDQLNKIGNNDEAFTRQMLEKFRSLVSECSESMRSAVVTSDWVKLKTIAHKNIPSYAIMGSEELVNLLKYIEAQAQNTKDYEHLSDILELVYEKNSMILNDISKHIKLSGSKKVDPVSN